MSKDRYKQIRQTIPPVNKVDEKRSRQKRMNERYIKGLRRKYDKYPNQLSPKELSMVETLIEDDKLDALVGDQ